MKIKNTPETGNLQIGDTFIKSGLTYLIIDDDFSGIEVELVNKLSAWRKPRKKHF